MKPEVQQNKIVVLSGSGLSAESGLPTFRDANGLWKQYAWHEVASPDGWRVRPEAVLAFYNERRSQAAQAAPNPAHLAIAGLEQAYEVVVITQNVDDLHERAGSTNIIHLHGELAYARHIGSAQTLSDRGQSRSAWGSCAKTEPSFARILSGLVKRRSSWRKRGTTSPAQQKCWWSALRYPFFLLHPW
ncbi:hypothetical protein LP419_35865 [Massilia sp. H-1]|nr:hypothetical protein LP419_35865 [Massilia sp. H-1]